MRLFMFPVERQGEARMSANTPANKPRVKIVEKSTT